MTNPDWTKAPDFKAIERAVLADIDRPCMYGVSGPCFHPNCLEAHFKTLCAESRYDTVHKTMQENKHV